MALAMGVALWIMRKAMAYECGGYAKLLPQVRREFGKAVG